MAGRESECRGNRIPLIVITFMAHDIVVSSRL